MAEDKIVGKLVLQDVMGYYGLELCLLGTKHRVVMVDEATVYGCDILLVSLFYYDDIYRMESFCRKTALFQQQKRPIVLIGGMQATITPELVSEYADFVFIGDGERHLESILDDLIAGRDPECPYLYSKGMGAVPAPAVETEIHPFAYKHASLKVRMQTVRTFRAGKKQSAMKKAATVYRIETARGCKYKCPFCVMSHLKPYSEATLDEIEAAVKTIPKGSFVSMFAPERTSHSEYVAIRQLAKKYELQSVGNDTRLERIDKIEGEAVTLGIEGVSQRLRKRVKKGWSNDYIFDRLKLFCTTGKRRHWGSRIVLYYIADLPGEDESDYEEIYSLFRRMSEAPWTRHMICMPTLNPLSPKPYTKFFGEEVHPFRNYPAIWAKFCRGGTGDDRWGFKVIETSVWNCWRRTLDAIVHRGGRDAVRVIRRISDKRLLHAYRPWGEAERASKVLLRIAEEEGLSYNALFGKIDTKKCAIAEGCNQAK